MKLIITDSGGIYYIMIKNFKSKLIFDIDISKFLNLTLQEYHNILFKYNGDLVDEDGYFENKEDATKAVEELEPYLIMTKLKGDSL